MKRLFIASCVSVACAVGAAAQAPTGTSKPQPSSPPTTREQPTTQKPGQGQADDKSAVLRGCLRAGDQGTFTLANATATSGGTLKNATVQLVGSPEGANLKAHVGHTVEVTGMLAAADAKQSGASPSTTTSTSKPAAGGATSSAGTAKLTVKAFKHVKEGC